MSQVRTGRCQKKPARQSGTERMNNAITLASPALAWNVKSSRLKPLPRIRWMAAPALLQSSHRIQACSGCARHATADAERPRRHSHADGSTTRREERSNMATPAVRPLSVGAGHAREKITGMARSHRYCIDGRFAFSGTACHQPLATRRTARVPG